MSLGTLLVRHARYRGPHLAVVCDDTRLDYATLSARVDRLAAALHHLGLTPGDHIATLLGNRLELLEIYWAAARLGLVVVPLSPLLRRQALHALLEDCGATVLFTETACADAVDEIRAAVTTVPDGLYVLVDPDGRADYTDLGALVARAGATAPPPPVVAPDAPYNIVYSSGTTGLPKGIVLTHRARMAYATSFAAAFRLTPESVVLHAGSLVFNGAFLTLMPALHQGATYVLQRQFQPAAFLAAIQREQVTHVVMVPTQIVALLASPAFDPAALRSLQMLCSVGAPLLRAHKDALHAALPGRLHELYGLTEGFVTVLDHTDVPAKLATVGVPPPQFELRIARADGTTAAPGEVGEVIGRGPILMTGYHQRPALTAATIVDGWLRTGDLGFADDDGYLHLVDRKKDMFISGGVNVYPRDIEEVIADHPAVREVAVFGVPDDTWGETAIAAVRPRHREVDAERLRAWINERVGAKYQRVRDVLVVDDFPRNATGKVLKRTLRDMYLTGGADPARGHLVVRDGVRIHYLRSGGRKPPLILLHGLTANAQFFAGLLAVGLADRHDVIRLDLRGRGLSDQPATGYSLAEHAADVLAVMDAAHVDDAVICGHSYGALLTLWLAAHHPRRVRRQVLLDIAAPSIADPEVLRLIQPSLDRLDREVASLDEYLARMRAHSYLAGAWCDELARYYRADVEVRQDGSVRPRTSRAVIEQCLARGGEEDWRAVVARAQVPALVVHAPGAYGPPGTRPLVGAEPARELARLLGDARFVEVPGNHVTMMFGAGADAVVAAIHGFADQRPGLS